MHSGFLLGFTHTPASYTSMASNIRNWPITPGEIILEFVLPVQQRDKRQAAQRGHFLLLER